MRAFDAVAYINVITLIAYCDFSDAASREL